MPDRRKEKDLFSGWANAALQHYDFQQPDLCFLGHSDNLTFRVKLPQGGVYLLRLHMPVVAYLKGIRQLPEVLESELVWMEALSREGGFTLQQPVYTRQGERVLAISGQGGEQIPCTVLTWCPGTHFSLASADAEGQIVRFGALVARMHEFAVGWSPAAGFIRPQYDQDHFRRIFARLLRGVDLGVFDEDAYRILRAVGQAILEEIEQVPTTPDHWGMIHADLHVGNFLVDGLNIFPIDFSFCGFGHYLFDVSVCLAGGLRANLRPAFLAGYRSVRPLPEEELRAVEAYALTGRLSYFAYQIDNPAERAWLTRRIPEVVTGECARFLKRESFLFEL